MEHDGSTTASDANNWQAQVDCLKKRLVAVEMLQRDIEREIRSLSQTFGDKGGVANSRHQIDNAALGVQNSTMSEENKRPDTKVSSAKKERQDVPEWRRQSPITVEKALENLEKSSNRVITRRVREKQALENL